MSVPAIFLTFLLFAASAQKCLWVMGALDDDGLSNKLDDDQIDQFLKMDSPEFRKLPWPDFNETFFLNADRRNFYFKISSYNESTWYDTLDWCKKREMRLASLTSLRQLKMVSIELQKRGWNDHKFWLSATDINRTVGDFRWSDGTPVNASTWYSQGRKEPDDFGLGNETCVFFNTYYAVLFDYSCLGNTSILCEFPEGWTGFSGAPVLAITPLTLLVILLAFFRL